MSTYSNPSRKSVQSAIKNFVLGVGISFKRGFNYWAITVINNYGFVADNVTIQCVVEGGNPPPRVYWFLNSRNLTNHSQVKSEYLDDTKIYISRSILRMDNITRSENNKSVLCVVDHELLTTANDEPSYLRAMAQFNIECEYRTNL